MGSEAVTANGGPERDPTPEDGDRYRDAFDAIERVLHDDNFPTGNIERLEIVLHASGDVTYKVWEPRADEPSSGYIAPGA